MVNESSINLGEAIRRQRVTIPLTLQELATISGVSPSHLGRVERGERYPSARVLRRIAEPLGFTEDELFTLAGYLSPNYSGVAEADAVYGGSGLDPYVASVLAREPVAVQRALVAILAILKNMAQGASKG
jgi:transcriptional regulator with XRE-family HTH domain